MFCGFARASAGQMRKTDPSFLFLLLYLELWPELEVPVFSSVGCRWTQPASGLLFFALYWQAIGDPLLKTLPKGCKIQLERQDA